MLSGLVTNEDQGVVNLVRGASINGHHTTSVVLPAISLDLDSDRERTLLEGVGNHLIVHADVVPSLNRSLNVKIDCVTCTFHVLCFVWVVDGADCAIISSVAPVVGGPAATAP